MAGDELGPEVRVLCAHLARHGEAPPRVRKLSGRRSARLPRPALTASARPLYEQLLSALVLRVNTSPPPRTSLPLPQRDSNMSVDEVRQQVEYVALVTKQASSASDLRRFEFSAPAIKAPVVYFRAATPGVCTYMDDRRDSGGHGGYHKR